jgi:hypothetical protein
VVRTEVLKSKYKGGIAAFLERHGARCNRTFAYLWSMSEYDLADPIVDLQMSGLTSNIDFVSFEPTWKAMGVEMAEKLGIKTKKWVKFPDEWLGGYVHNGGMIVYYIDNAKEAKKR